MELKASEQTFSTLFSTMREGFAFHEVICNAAGEVIDYRYLEINPAFEQLTGLKRETTVGRTVREVLPGIEEEWIQCFGNVALTGIPDERENYVQELDRYYRARAYSPEIGTFAVVFEETTAQRRAQRELERREALYNDLVETATDLVWRCDSEGCYIFLNRAWEKAFGYHIDEMLGHRFTDFMTSEQAERDSAIFAQLLATSGQVTGYETIHLRKDGPPCTLCSMPAITMMMPGRSSAPKGQLTISASANNWMTPSGSAKKITGPYPASPLISFTNVPDAGQVRSASSGSAGQPIPSPAITMKKSWPRGVGSPLSTPTTGSTWRTIFSALPRGTGNRLSSV